MNWINPVPLSVSHEPNIMYIRLQEILCKNLIALLREYAINKNLTHYCV